MKQFRLFAPQVPQSSLLDKLTQLAQNSFCQSREHFVWDVIFPWNNGSQQMRYSFILR